MSQSLRVLHVIHSGAIRGGPQVVLNLVSRLKAEHTVASPNDGPLLDDVRNQGASTITLRRAGEFSFMLSVPIIARLSRMFDIVHLHGQFAGFYGSAAAALARVPIVYTAHFPSFVTDSTLPNRARNYVAEFVPGRLSRIV